MAPEATTPGYDDADLGETGMRTDRPDPWGFDLYDPRITMRQLAADAQRRYEADVPEPDRPTTVDDGASSEPQDRELVGGSAR